MPITDFNMTRFWISLKEPVEFLNYMIENILNKNTGNKIIDMENKTGGGLCSRLEDIIQ